MSHISRSKEKGRAATIGMFDGVHRGHRFLIENLRTLNTSTLPPLIFTFADHPLALLKPDSAPKLITSPEHKTTLLQTLSTEPVMLQFDQNIASTSARDFMAMLHRDYGVTQLLLGFNNRFGHDRGLQFHDYVNIGSELGIEITKAPELPAETAISSSVIRNLLTDGQIVEAQRMLGHTFSLTGRVTTGRRIGHTIGFPTANIDVDTTRLLIPSRGVYACDAILPNGTRRRAAVNIGYRPSVDHSSLPALTIEAHIIGFEGNLYDEIITIDFIDKIRDERQFPSLDDLMSQIKLDISQCISL